MAVTNIPISKQGYKRLEEELARLKSERPAIIQAIKAVSYTHLTLPTIA